MIKTRVSNIKNEFLQLKEKNIVADNETIEIVNASFIADEPTIFGELNEEYAKCEFYWYMSQSLNVNDMPCAVPKIWKDVSGYDGNINSNYGWCIFSKDNFNQFNNCIKTLQKDKSSRQATMIYNRPSMHIDSTFNGCHDFMCTYSVQLLIRDDELHYMVYMRSNDAIFGYKNDRYWHDMVFDMAFNKLKAIYENLTKGRLYWNAASLHIYPRHFDLIKL